MRNQNSKSIEKVRSLYSNLVQDGFKFLGKDEFALKEIYSAVKKRYPNLCDDGYKCEVCCHCGTKSPEWQHRVRTVLGTLKKSGGNVRNGAARGLWIIA